MKVAAASTTISVTNAAMQEYAKISLRTLAIVTLRRAASPIRAATLRSLQRRGEKVKFFELEPLNARKNSGCATREANDGVRQKLPAEVAMAKVTTPLTAQERVILFCAATGISPTAVGITAPAMQSMAIKGFIIHDRETGAYALTDRRDTPCDPWGCGAGIGPRSGAKLRCVARGGDGGVRKKLAARAMKRKPRKLLPGLRTRMRNV
jgi:hypothetical protein